VYARIEPILTLGCHHEQQHQELILTDIKYNFACNPLRPAYRDAPEPVSPDPPGEASWVPVDGGLYEIGASGGGFAFDNECPRHSTFLSPFALASRTVTNGEYREFIDDGGYRRPDLWLDLGYAAVAERGWEHPEYWIAEGGSHGQFTLSGVQPLVDAEPVCHLSFFEADAYARWSGHRLPTEAEWEVAVASQAVAVTGNFAESGRYHVLPAAAPAGRSLQQAFGDVWEWTASPYVGYPGFRAPQGAIGEYNGKFMCNQYVLRGGSCATSQCHVRASYRNFFPPDARWQFAGLRLATDT
jgi:ergothioneine biosynthesis protein EgtB